MYKNNSFKFDLSLLLLLVCIVVCVQGCSKSDTVVTPGEDTQGRKKNPPPPPPPPPFYFTNCNSNPLYSATLTVGVPSNVTFVKNYVNSPGGSYPAFTSATVNGITVTASAGTFNTGS